MWRKRVFSKALWLIKWHVLSYFKSHGLNTLSFQRTGIFLPGSFGMRQWIIACMVTKVFNRWPRITKKRELLLHDHTRDKTTMVTFCNVNWVLWKYVKASYEPFCMWLWQVGRVMRGVKSSIRRRKWQEEEQQKREFGEGWWWWQCHVVCIFEKGEAMTSIL